MGCSITFTTTMVTNNIRTIMMQARNVVIFSTLKVFVPLGGTDSSISEFIEW